MRIKFIIICLLIIPSSVFSDVYPQAGLESYTGPNNFFSITPWIGLRMGLSNHASFILKYYNHNIRFHYQNDDSEKIKRSAQLSNFTAVLYAQKWQHDFYSALSLFLGTDSYRALAFNAGTALKISKKLTVEVGTYLLNEKSVLWYPTEEVRNISLYSLNGGGRFYFNERFNISSKIYVYRNSEDVSASTYSVGLTFIPKPPIYITLNYFRYSESSQYRFSGNYLSFGINFYY